MCVSLSAVMGFALRGPKRQDQQSSGIDQPVTCAAVPALVSIPSLLNLPRVCVWELSMLNKSRVQNEWPQRGL